MTLELPGLVEVGHTALPLWRGAVAAMGMLLVGWGGKLPDRGVRLAVLAAVSILGHLLVHMDGTPLGPGKPWIDAGTVAILAGIGLAVADWRSRVSLAIPGALLGIAMADGMLGLPMHEPATQWAAVAAGSFLLPFLFEPIPMVAAPLVGAVALTWGFGVPHSPSVVGMVFGAGVVAHLLQRTRKTVQPDRPVDDAVRIGEDGRDEHP